ncbi:hypothetical protein GPK34_00365 [Secundilactobacillus kimchicus]|uniref:hypothetical protein n=1 Tax=Secundilactobacillus kimchicus TaxID=528209 RepID=UPI001C03694C|nr:hypothetical protein [Secundilactobacillus kimchicus]MBT9670490.1 hypothetical protein [Secundilactobacillus kimchicus]
MISLKELIQDWNMANDKGVEVTHKGAWTLSVERAPEWVGSWEEYQRASLQELRALYEDYEGVTADDMNRDELLEESGWYYKLVAINHKTLQVESQLIYDLADPDEMAQDIMKSWN